jgi:hypothetical protein
LDEARAGCVAAYTNGAKREIHPRGQGGRGAVVFSSERRPKHPEAEHPRKSLFVALTGARRLAAHIFPVERRWPMRHASATTAHRLEELSNDVDGLRPCARWDVGEQGEAFACRPTATVTPGSLMVVVDGQS